jgi:hypothetical protein
MTEEEQEIQELLEEAIEIEWKLEQYKLYRKNLIQDIAVVPLTILLFISPILVAVSLAILSME